MLSAPHGDVTVMAAAEAKPATSDKAKEAEEPTTNWEPQSDWNQSRYNRALFRAIVMHHDASTFAAVDTAYRGSALGKDIALTIWEARIEFLRMIAGEQSDFEKIKNAARGNPTNSELLYFMASGYQEFGQIEAAARTYEDAASNTDSSSDRLRYLASAAIQYARAEQWKRSTEITETLRRNAANTPDLRYPLLANLQDLAIAEKNDVLELAIMEQMVELRPSDSSTRFSLAYKHSQIGNSDMALHHYLKIPVFERGAITWNNLGVAFEAFGMPIRAISAYRNAEDKNETLAMCNLGFKLLGSGFISEAQVEADKAFAVKPHHENVPELLKRLRDAPEEEKKKLTDALDRVKEKVMFYQKLGDCVLKSTPAEIARNWTSPDGPLEAQVDGTTARFSGTRQRATSLGAFLGGAFNNQVATERVEYSGELRGNAIFGRIKRATDEQPTSMLSSLDDDVKVAMALSEDRTTIFVMERPDGLHPKFYTLTCSS